MWSLSASAPVPRYRVDHEEKSFATLSVLFFGFNNALAHLEAAQRADLALFSSGKKYTEAEPRDFLTMD